LAPLVIAPHQQRQIKQEKVMTSAASNTLPDGPQQSTQRNLGVRPTQFVPKAEKPEFASMYAANGLSQPYVYKASNADPDTLSYEEVMKDVDKSKWITAAKKEIKSLEDQNTWTEVDISEATSRILPSQWVFKQKRTPDGKIKSYNGRTVARGDLEEGVFDTYTPVVASSSVDFFLVLSLILEWNTCSIDFSLAFVQEKLEKAVWLHLPRGGFILTQNGKLVSDSTKASTDCLSLPIFGMSICSRH
jgi:hypothetical protein